MARSDRIVKFRHVISGDSVAGCLPVHSLNDGRIACLPARLARWLRCNFGPLVSPHQGTPDPVVLCHRSSVGRDERPTDRHPANTSGVFRSAEALFPAPHSCRIVMVGAEPCDISSSASRCTSRSSAPLCADVAPLPLRPKGRQSGRAAADIARGANENGPPGGSRRRAKNAPAPASATGRCGPSLSMRRRRIWSACR